MSKGERSREESTIVMIITVAEDVSAIESHTQVYIVAGAMRLFYIERECVIVMTTENRLSQNNNSPGHATQPRRRTFPQSIPACPCPDTGSCSTLSSPSPRPAPSSPTLPSDSDSYLARPALMLGAYNLPLVAAPAVAPQNVQQRRHVFPAGSPCDSEPGSCCTSALAFCAAVADPPAWSLPP